MAPPVVEQVFSVHRLSVEDVLAMSEAGLLDDDLRYELVDGVLIEMSHAGPRHARVVEWLTRHFVVGGAERFGVRIQDCLLTTDGGLRSPDLMVLELIGADRLPETALIVIEVASTSPHAMS